MLESGGCRDGIGGLLMEKLILRCGRYMPPASGDAEARVRLLERYVARLSEELERLLGETAGVTDSGEAATAVWDEEGGGA